MGAQYRKESGCSSGLSVSGAGLFGYKFREFSESLADLWITVACCFDLSLPTVRQASIAHEYYENIAACSSISRDRPTDA